MADQTVIQVVDFHERDMLVWRGPWDGRVQIGERFLRFYIVTAFAQEIRDASCIVWNNNTDGISKRHLDIAKGKILESLEAKGG